MKKNNIAFLLIVSIIVLISSLFLDWMVIKSSVFAGSTIFKDTLGFSSTLGIDGFNGYVLIVPIWFFVLIGIGGAVITLLNHFKIIALHKNISIWCLIFTGLLSSSVIINSIFSSEAAPKLGGFVALIGVYLALKQTTQPDKKHTDTESAIENQVTEVE